MPAPAREEIRIQSNGEELAAWLYRAEGDGETPCVVLMHGFTATRDEQLDRFCERFAAAGCSAIAFDFRHFGASGGEPRQLLDLGRQYEDCDAALAHARGLEGIDGSRVVVWGTSFAGGHALDAAARNTWLAAAICLVPLMDGAVPPPGMTARKAAWSIAAGVRDTVRAARGTDPYLVPAVGPATGRAVIANAGAWDAIPRVVPEHSLWRNEVAARIMLRMGRHRPVKHAAEVRCPVLVQIVEGDTVVRNSRAEKAASSAPNGSLRRYPGLDHFDVYTPPGFDAVIDDQLAFLRRHVLAG
jgi:dienelactone hydrolase